MTTQKQPPKTKKTTSNGLPDHIGGVAVPVFLTKIPLPVLGASVAFICMILYIFIVAATTPLPGELQGAGGGQAPAIPTPPPAAAAAVPPPVPLPASPPSSAPPQGGGGAGTATPPPPSTPPALPTYQGPVGETALAASGTGGLPVVTRTPAALPDLGRKVLMSQGDFNAKTQEITAPAGTDMLRAYRFRLPSDWTLMSGNAPIQGGAAQGVMAVMAEYVSPARPGEARSRVRISSEKLLYALPLADWVRKYAFDNGLVLQAMSSFGPDRVEAVYLTTKTEATQVVRFAATLNGPQVIMADYAVPMERYEQEKDLQTWVVASFYVPAKDTSPPEEIAGFSFYDLAGFDYYKSWRPLNQNLADTAAMSVSLTLTKTLAPDPVTQKAAEVLQGRIDVFVLSKAAAGQNVTAESYVQKWLGLQHLQRSEPIGTFLPPENKHNLVRTRAEVHNITNMTGNYQSYQYFTVEFEGQNYLYYIGLMAPPEVGDAANWARIHTAFDQVIRSLHEGN